MGDGGGEEERALPRTVESFHQLQYEAHEQHRAAERRLPGFSGRRAEVAALTSFLDCIGGPSTMLVRGPRGSGKTTLVAEMLRQRRIGQVDQGRAPSSSQQQPSPEYVSWHSFADTIYPADLARGLERICIDLKVRFDLSIELPENLADIAPAFRSFVEHACLAARIVIVMDGVESAQVGKLGHSWLPLSLPLGAKIVMTSAPCPWLRVLKERSTVTELALPGLSFEEARSILNKALCCYPGGEFGGLDASDLLKLEGRSLPLFIHAASGLARIIQDEAKNVGYVQEQLANFPATLDEIYIAQLDRLEMAHGKVVVQELCGLLASSKFGLSQDNLLELLRQNADIAAQETALLKLLRVLEENLWMATSAPGSPTDNAIRFYSAGFKKAVLERYLPGRSERLMMHRRLAAYLTKQQPQARILQERMYQYSLSEDWKPLRDCLCSPKLWLYCFDNIDMYTLVELYVSLTSSGQCPSSMFLAEYKRKCSELRAAESEKLLDYFHSMASFMFWLGKHGEVMSLLEEYLTTISEEEEHIYAPDPKYMDLVSFLGDTYSAKKMYEKAHNIFSKGRETCVRLYGEFSVPVAALSSRSAACLRCMGRTEEACDVYKAGTALWAASERRNVVTETSWKYAACFNDLAEVQEELGRCAEAEESNEAGLARLEAMLGPDHPAVVEQLVTMGQGYKDHGEWQKSEFCYSRALTFCYQFYGSISVPLVQTYVSLAELHCAKGAQGKAKEFYGRALQITVAVFGKEHAEVAIILNNIAETCRVQMLFAEAEPLYLQALAIDMKVSGAESSAVAIRLNNLAELYRDQKQIRKAEAFYRKALKIGESSLGRSHPNLATYLNNLAGVCKAQRKWSESEDLYQRAKEIDVRALGEYHPDISIYLNNIACLYKAQGRLEDAEPVYKEALAIIEEALGKDHSDVAVYSNNLGLLYKQMGRLEEAEELYLQSIDITRASSSKEIQLAKRLTNLGTLKFQIRKLDEALELFIEAHGIFEAVFGDEHPDTMACGAWLDTITAEFQDVKGETRALGQEKSTRSEGKDQAPFETPKPLKVHEEETQEISALADELQAPEFSPEPTLLATPVESASAGETVDEDTILNLSVEKLFSSALDEARGVANTDDELELARIEPCNLSERPTPTFEQNEEHSRHKSLESEGDIDRGEPEIETHTEPEIETRTEPEAPREAGMRDESSSELHLPHADKSFKADREAPVAREESLLTDVAKASGSAGVSTPEQGFQAEEIVTETERTHLIQDRAELGGLEGKDAEKEAPGETVKAVTQVRGSISSATEHSDSVSGTDALVMKNVEFVGSRQYRCLECGKLMSTFNLIRMHYLKSHVGHRAESLPPRPDLSSQEETAPAQPVEEPRVIDMHENSQGGESHEVSPPQARVDIFGPQDQQNPDAGILQNGNSEPAITAEPEKRASPEKPQTPREAALKRVQELEERLAQMQSQLNNQNASMMASSALQLLEAGMRQQMQFRSGYSSGQPSPQPQNIQDITNVFHHVDREASQPTSGSNANAAAYRQAQGSQPPPPKADAPLEMVDAAVPDHAAQAYHQGRTSPAEANPLFGVRATPSLDERGRSSYGADDFDSMMRHERGLLRPALNTPFSASQISIKVDSPSTPLARAFGEPSPAHKAQKQVESLLGGQSGDVDFIGLFMTARSQQLGKRRFVCELDGQEFTTLNIMRVHFERKYAAEAQRWWKQQAGM